VLSSSGLEVNVLAELENAAKLYGIVIIDIRPQGYLRIQEVLSAHRLTCVWKARYRT